MLLFLLYKINAGLVSKRDIKALKICIFENTVQKRLTGTVCMYMCMYMYKVQKRSCKKKKWIT